MLCNRVYSGFVLRGYSSITVTSEFIYACETFLHCNRTQGGTVCTTCIEILVQTSKKVSKKIPAASRMGKAICNATLYGVESHSSLKLLVAASVTLLNNALQVRSKFFTRFDPVANESIKNYTQEHKDGNSTLYSVQRDWLEEAVATSQLFPSNPIVRPSIGFAPRSWKENSQSCRKNFEASESHSPSISTVQCVCRYPKLIGISRMEVCEGTSTALSVLLSRFKKLPKFCYYDDSCNLAKFIVLRVPWINEDCINVSDRFLYRGHKCNTVCDPNSYGITKKHSTSAAQFIYQQWEFSISHVRFLNPNNLMPYLCMRAIFINVCARVREKKYPRFL